jgi:hypothetical protein
MFFVAICLQRRACPMWPTPWEKGLTQSTIYSLRHTRLFLWLELVLRFRCFNQYWSTCAWYHCMYIFKSIFNFTWNYFSPLFFFIKRTHLIPWLVPQICFRCKVDLPRYSNLKLILENLWKNFVKREWFSNFFLRALVLNCVDTCYLFK